VIILSEEMKKILKIITLNKDLDDRSAAKAMELIMSGMTTPAQIGAFLAGLRLKGEKPSEIAAFAKVMRAFSKKVSPEIPKNDIMVDTCGTGGDAIKTFNISTLSALVLAAAGVRVAKHGNRSITSTCGSADLLEGFGVNINAQPEIVKKCIEKVGIGFMFAPVFHPAMKHALGPRKELGIRTVFNILGPLTNPAEAKAQIVGIYSPDLTEKIAQTLKLLGIKRALTFHGMPGLDEFSNIGRTFVSELENGGVRNYVVQVEDFGLTKATIGDIKGGTVEKNIQISLSILNGEKSPKMDIVLMNAAAGLYVASKVDALKDGVELARDVINTGKPHEVLRNLVETSGGNKTIFEKLEDNT